MSTASGTDPGEPRDPEGDDEGTLRGGLPAHPGSRGHMQGSLLSPEAQPAEPGRSPAVSPGLDISAISLHIALDTPQRERTPEGEEKEEIVWEKDAGSVQVPSNSEPCEGGQEADKSEPVARRRPPLLIDTRRPQNISGVGGAATFDGALQTPKNTMSTPGALDTQNCSGLSSASSMLAVQLQTPARRRGDLAESEQELLSKSGGALVCLYSEDMAPLVSVAHGMQLPRAQIGLLGACFTSCRSNAFELNKVCSGDSTISYRSLLGGRVLAVIVLSSWGGSSGSLLDTMLKQMHDSVWAAVRLVVGEQTVMQLLDSNKVSQLRKALKPATLLFQHLLTGRTEVAVLTRSLGAVSHLTANNSTKASQALARACAQLAVPGLQRACVLADGKLVCATRSWCELATPKEGATRSNGDGGGWGRGVGNEGEVGSAGSAQEAADEADVQVMLLHMLATNMASDSNVAVVPVHGLPPPQEPARGAALGMGDSRTAARHHLSASSNDVLSVVTCGDDSPQDAAPHVATSAREGGLGGGVTTYRLLLIGLAPRPLVEQRGGAASEDGEASDLRLCVLVPGTDSQWSLPDVHELDAIRESLENSLYPVLLPPPSLAIPSTIGGHSEAEGYFNGDAAAVAGNGLSNGGGHGERGREGLGNGQMWWQGQHPWLRRVVLLRRGQMCGGMTEDKQSAQTSATPSLSGFSVFWELQVPDAAVGRLDSEIRGGEVEGKWYAKSGDVSGVSDNRKLDAHTLL